MIKSDWRHRSGGALLILLCASLCAVAQSGQPATAKVETKTGAIDGRVVNENGEPHVNANVLIRPDTPQGLPVTHITTNRDGVFKVSGLQPGAYNVSTTVPAHLPKSLYPAPVVSKAGEPVTLVLVKGGVVTGTVTNAKGDPLIAIGVRVRMVRDDGGRSYGGDMGRYYDNITDDRGVYRVYGLPTGTYVVSADGSVEERTSIRRTVNGFAKDLPTYAPSSNREDANEINVRLGEEVSNVDIRYRGERGSSISGILNGTSDDGRGFSATLTSIVQGGPRWNNAFRQNQFAFDGIPNGEYHLVASASWNDGTRRLSESIVVNVRGADIEGLELTASPLASIDGRVVLEPLTAPPAECSEKRQPQFSEISVTAWHRVTEGGRKKPQFVWRAGPSANANAQGKFTVSDLATGEYHFGVRFHTPQWFLKSVAFAPPAPNSIPTNAMGTWTTVKPGDRLSDLTFTFAQGSATVNGEISLAEGQKLPEKIVAFVVPAEIEKADEVLRYHAVPVSSDGRFWVYVAPGRYWILAQVGTDDTRREMSRLRLPDGAEIRATLRRAAEEAKSEIQLKPCQSVPVRLPL